MLTKKVIKKVKEIKMDKIEIGKARAARIEPSGRCGLVCSRFTTMNDDFFFLFLFSIFSLFLSIYKSH